MVTALPTVSVPDALVLKLNVPLPISMAVFENEKLSAAETYPLLVVVDGFAPWVSIVAPDDLRDQTRLKDRRRYS